MDQATDIELGFPAENIIGYWKQKEDRNFTKRMSANSQPPPEYPPVSKSVTTQGSEAKRSLTEEYLWYASHVPLLVAQRTTTAVPGVYNNNGPPFFYFFSPCRHSSCVIPADARPPNFFHRKVYHVSHHIIEWRVQNM